MSAAFTRACDELKIDDLHFHDLRHEGTIRAPERDTSGDAALIRRLDRMSRQLERADRDVSVLAETIALFIRYYLTITPPLPS